MRGGGPKTTMGTRPGLLLFIVVASLSSILPGSHQYPQNVVFQPVTYQLTTMGLVDPDISPVYSPTIRQSYGDAGDQLICKKIQQVDGLFRVSPTTQSAQLFVIPSTIIQPLTDSPLSRFLLAVPTVHSVGTEDIQSEIPEGAYAAPPPLMASMCVSQDSPRPFPVLFAPPPASQLGSIVDSDFKKDDPFRSTSTLGLETPLKVSLNSPSMGGVTLGLHGVPATVESISPSIYDPAGRILVKLHTNPPGTISLSISGGEGMIRGPEASDPEYSAFPRGQGILTNTEIPSVSLVFSSPIGNIGIGSTNAPAVNIERQNIVASGKIPKTSVFKDWTLN